MTTHDLPYAHEICGRAVILDSGRVAADGPTDEILGDADLLAALANSCARLSLLVQ